MACPCKNCERRGCGSYHDECEKYAEFKKKREDVISRRYAESEQTGYIVQACIRTRGKKK